MDADATDLGLGVAGLAILGLSTLCIAVTLLRSLCKDYRDKSNTLLNYEDDGISEV